MERTVSARLLSRSRKEAVGGSDLYQNANLIGLGNVGFRVGVLE